MKKQALEIFRAIIVLLCVIGVASGVRELSVAHGVVLPAAKIGLSIVGFFAFVAAKRKETKISDILYTLWFVPQFVAVSTRSYSPDRSFFWEIVRYDVSNLNFGYNLSWNLKEGSVLSIHFNILLIFGAYLFQRLSGSIRGSIREDQS